MNRYRREAWKALPFGSVTRLILEDPMRPYSRRNSCVLQKVYIAVNNKINFGTTFILFAGRDRTFDKHPAVLLYLLSYKLLRPPSHPCVRIWWRLHTELTAYNWIGQRERARTSGLSLPRGALFQLSYTLIRDS